MKLNHIRINMLGEPKSPSSSSGGGSTPSDYDLQSRQLILPVESTTITTKEGKTAAVATNDHIKIVDENMQAYTVKEWNDRSVANGFDNSLVAKPIGFRMQANDVDVLFRWPFTGKIWNCLGTSSADNAMQHSLFEYDQRTSAGSGADYTCSQDANLGTNTVGSHRAADWEITDDGDSLTLYCGNTGQSWQMAKNCGNANFMAAFNYDERCDAMIAQNEWMRHRFAICSGVKTTEPDGTVTSVEILNSAGTQAAVGEDMYFYVDGVNTSLKAKYNINNRHAGKRRVARHAYRQAVDVIPPAAEQTGNPAQYTGTVFHKNRNHMSFHAGILSTPEKEGNCCILPPGADGNPDKPQRKTARPFTRPAIHPARPKGGCIPGSGD